MTERTINIEECFPKCNGIHVKQFARLLHGNWIIRFTTLPE